MSLWDSRPSWITARIVVLPSCSDCISSESTIHTHMFRFADCQDNDFVELFAGAAAVSSKLRQETL